jgi:hypothetical protein
MESKKINQLATELAPDLSDLTIIGDPTTGISKKITLSQMASLFTGTVEEYANFAAFPLVGVADTIYIALDTNILYRWNTGTSAYVELSPNIVSSLVFNDANGFDGTINLVGSVATLTITTALTTGSVGFIGASGALLQDNANFFWDDTNNRLGLGTNAPTTALDVFGSGIIGRINGTSTNNAYLGFASAGTNKWSVGNVQSDHRFRIFSEANSAELITILQTGEFGIGIANPTTKIHIDGGSSALIANLDANVSVAKSVSFRSDNSNRFNIEVSGTESGSNVGADFFIRRYSDAGSLIDTPLTITRSTGNATFSGILTTPQIKAATSAGLSINANSGTQVADFGAGGSANITFFGGLSGTSASFSSTATASAFIPSGATIPTNGMYLSAANNLNFATNSTNRLSISSTGLASFANNVIVNGSAEVQNGNKLSIYRTDNTRAIQLYATNDECIIESWEASSEPLHIRSFGSGGRIQFFTNALERLRITNTGAIKFSDGTLSGAGGFEITSEAFFGARFQSNAYKFMAGNNSTEYMRLLSTNGGQLIVGGSTNTFIDYSGSVARFYGGSGTNTFGLGAGSTIYYQGDNSQFYPTADNARSIGLGSNRYTAIYAVNGTIQTSDEREKTDIVNSDLGLDFVSKLRPVSFKWKIGQNIQTTEIIIDEEGNEKIQSIITPRAGIRTHYGLIAQEVEELLNGKDFGGFIHDKESDIKGLRYDQFVPLLIKAIQEQQAQIEELKALINK